MPDVFFIYERLYQKEKKKYKDPVMRLVVRAFRFFLFSILFETIITYGHIQSLPLHFVPFPKEKSLFQVDLRQLRT